jgi:hypothetical protein
LLFAPFFGAKDVLSEKKTSDFALQTVTECVSFFFLRYFAPESIDDICILPYKYSVWQRTAFAKYMGGICTWLK